MTKFRAFAILGLLTLSLTLTACCNNCCGCGPKLPKLPSPCCCG